MTRQPTPKCCPNCGSLRTGLYGLRINQSLNNSVMQFCTACGWNNKPETRAITKEQYQYWCRLTRIGFSPWQKSPPKRKQAVDILKSIVHELYAQDVPYWMRDHLQKAAMPYLGSPRWYFSSFCKSRWEYHTMLEYGTIKTPQEYQQFYIERREWEASQPYDEDEWAWLTGNAEVTE